MSTARYSLTLKVGENMNFFIKLHSRVGDYKRLQEEASAIDWKGIAERLENKYGGSEEVDRIWSEEYEELLSTLSEEGDK